MKNTLLLNFLVAVLIAAGAFYGGTVFEKNQIKNQVPGTMQGGRFFRNGANRGQGMEGNRPVSGEIIGKDDKSITIKMTDGSTKIVIVSVSTAINKSTEGTVNDLATGDRIVAFGQNNPDGSITAQSISIGETMFRGFVQGTPAPTP